MCKIKVATLGNTHVFIAFTLQELEKILRNKKKQTFTNKDYELQKKKMNRFRMKKKS